MKKATKLLLIISLVVILALSVTALVACDVPEQPSEPNNSDSNSEWGNNQQDDGTQKRHTVTFHLNGGNYMEKMGVGDGETIPEQPDVPQKTDYVFAGWYKDEACTQKWNLETDKVTEDISLYAKWRPIYRVEINTNCDTYLDVQEVVEGDCAEEPTIINPGYTFAGWDYDFAQPITSNTTITAGWTPNQYTITYDANGGELSETQCVVTYGEAYSLAIPTREGYSFDGWWIGERLLAYTNGQSFINWNFPENRTTTAKWVANLYQLHIVTSYLGEGNAEHEGLKEYDSEVTVIADEPYIGYDWIGWYRGQELLSTEMEYTFKMFAETEKDNGVTLTATYKVWDDLSGYEFQSTLDTCTITGVKDRTVTEITIPEYVTAIGNIAFIECGSLTSITIPESVTVIENSAFYECNGLTSVYYTGSITDWCKISFGDMCSNPVGYAQNLYIDGELLTELIVDSTITEIKPFTFQNCINLANVTFHNDVTTIGESAFA